MNCETLWNNNMPLVRKCLYHPFVQGLCDGTLDREKFKQYIGQDAYFLNAFMNAYSYAEIKTADVQLKHLFRELIQGVHDELEVHRKYSEELGIDLNATVPNSACKAYTSFLLETAQNQPVDVILAAMVPCMSLYAFLGTELKKIQSSDEYQTWIENYSSAAFIELAAMVEDMLNKVIADKPHVQEAYTRAMQLEFDFFDACA